MCRFCARPPMRSVEADKSMDQAPCEGVTQSEPAGAGYVMRITFWVLRDLDASKGSRASNPRPFDRTGIGFELLNCTSSGEL